MAGGYEQGAPRTILWDYNFMPDGFPHMDADLAHSTTKYEKTFAADHDEIYNFANPAGSMSILVKFSP